MRRATPRPRTRIEAAALALVFMAGTVASAAAQAPPKRNPPREPDAESGRIIAERLCVSCHLIGNSAQPGPVPAGVPSFAAIANRPGQTAIGIAGGIVVPHPPMPDIALTRDEIADLAAYIQTLKTP